MPRDKKPVAKSLGRAALAGNRQVLAASSADVKEHHSLKSGSFCVSILITSSIIASGTGINAVITISHSHQ